MTKPEAQIMPDVVSYNTAMKACTNAAEILKAVEVSSESYFIIALVP